MNRPIDAVCIGFTCVDQAMTGLDLDKFNEIPFHSLRDVQFGPGGDALNEAVVLSRLGYRTRLIAKVGGDFLGEYLQKVLDREGVDTQSLVVDPDVKTSLAATIVGEHDQRRFLWAGEGRSNAVFTGDEVDTACFRAAKIVSFDSLFVLPRMDVPAMESIFRAAKEAGCILCVDVKMEGNERIEDIASILPYVDYIFPNLGEGRLLTGKDTPEEIAGRFLDCGVGCVVLKLGAPGCYLRTAEEEHWSPSYLTEAVDTTGAGDNFAAGFLSGLIRNLPLETCAKYAAAASSLSVRTVGALTGVQNMDQVEQVIRDGEADWRANTQRVSTGWVIDKKQDFHL